ncbi:hypothetical protein VNI00_008495 [Paramarasmius palmivorus]|uniref:F-box domain-containing protein n=1 Tax=Paramarasmius palmivorus TaxID=297713 RepID=A0AAW0CTJ5_9AGAR
MTLPTSPFLSRIGTTLDTSPEERLVIQRLISDGEKRLQVIQDEISKLQAEQDEVKKFIEDHRAFVSPIRLLHADILREIFYQCLPQRELPKCRAREAPLLLTTVCRGWREVVITTPNLWNRVDISLPRLYDPPITDQFRSLMRAWEEGIVIWLERSGKMPLELSFSAEGMAGGWGWSGNWNIDGESCEELEQLYANVMRCLLAHASRWKSLCLNAPSTVWETFASLAEDLPWLESFKTNGLVHSTMDTRGQPLALLIKRSPSLRMLHFQHAFSHLPVRWNFLTKVSSRLRALSLRHYTVSAQIDPENLWHAVPLVTLPNLLSLNIQFSEDRVDHGIETLTVALQQIFDSIVAPKLTHLCAMLSRRRLGNIDTPLNRVPFLDFLERSGCTLQSLALDLPLVDDALIHLLAATASLEQLKLQMSGASRYRFSGQIPMTLNDTIIHALTPSSTNTDILCPNLEVFMHGSCVSSSVEALLAFAKARSLESEYSTVRRLRRLQVHFDRFIENEEMQPSLESLRKKGMSIQWVSPSRRRNAVMSGYQAPPVAQFQEYVHSTDIWWPNSSQSPTHGPINAKQAPCKAAFAREMKEKLICDGSRLSGGCYLLHATMILPTSPFLSQIGTAYDPSPQERLDIQELITSREKRLQAIQDEISKLQAEEEDVNKFIEGHRTLVSPIRRLHPDILHEIFYHCLPQKELPKCRASEAPLLLTVVCRAWRNIAITTPNLWNRIHISLPRPYDPPLTDKFRALMHSWEEGIQIWLERSGTMPIQLSFSAEDAAGSWGWNANWSAGIDWNMDAESGAELERLYASIVRRLLAHASRWQSLSFDAPNAVWEPLASLSEQLPWLERFKTGCSIYSALEARGRPLANLITRSPSLRIFHSQDAFSRLPVRWNCLTEVVLSEPSFSTTVQLSQAMEIFSLSGASLRHYTVSARIDPENTFHAIPLVTLPNLLTLNIQLSEGRPGLGVETLAMHLQQIFDSIATPKLTHFCVMLTRHRLGVEHIDSFTRVPFLGLLERSGCTLQSLNLDLPVVDDALLHLLSGMTSLKQLKLQMSGVSRYRFSTWTPRPLRDTIIHALTPSSTNIDVLCPNLEVFMHGFCSSSSVDSLLALANARSPESGCSTVCGLERFQAHFDRFIESKEVQPRLEALRKEGMSIQWVSPSNRRDEILPGRFGTNYGPSPQEIVEIRQVLDEPNKQLRAIEAEIARLQAQHDELRTFIDNHNALLSPIRRAPTDILREIFVHCLPDEHLPCRNLREAPLLLTGICKGWREVAVTTPALWNRIHISHSFPSSSRDLPSFRSLMQMRTQGVVLWLRRAGSLPLAISLYATLPSEVLGVRFPYERRDLEELEVIYVDSVRHLLQCSSRWGSISLDAPWCIVKLLQNHQFNEQLGALTSFRFMIGDREPHGSDLHPLTNILTQSSESLRVLHVEGRFILPICCLRNLTEVTLLGIEPKILHALLLSCKSLRRCTVTVWMSGRNVAATNVDGGLAANVLPYLHTLNLTLGDRQCHREIFAFLGALMAPALSNLRLADKYSTYAVETLAIVSFVERSGCTLKSFEPDFPMTTGEMANLLSVMPFLSTFHFHCHTLSEHGTGADAAAFAHLLSTPGPILPLLETISLFYCAPSDVEPLLAFAEARLISEDGQPPKLRKMKATFRRFLCDVEIPSRLEGLRTRGLSVQWSSPKDNRGKIVVRDDPLIGFDQPIRESSYYLEHIY